MIRRSIGLVACSKTKLDHAAPARELYRSRLFQLSLLEAERECDHVYIVSAEHGLLALDTVIEPYDTTIAGMCKEYRVCWGHRVIDSLRRLQPSASTKRHLVFYAGADYVKPILHATFRADGDTFAQPLAHKQIGQRLQWLAARGQFTKEQQP